MRMALIINPSAGSRRLAPRVRRLAERMAADRGVALSVVMINGPGHGRELARKAVSAGAGRVLCAGGDGTLNAVAAGLIGTGVPLGVVPTGSGNGYAHSLGLPGDAKKALRLAFTGAPRRMDVGYLNDRLFLGTAGVGFDARVAHRFDRSRRRGMVGYLRIILEEIAGAKTTRVRLITNGQATEAEVLMLVFCNTREFGNGARISPSSRPDDGVAELRLVRKPPLKALPLALLSLYTRRADRLSYIRSIAATEAELFQDGTLAHLDGEPATIGPTVRFRLEPRCLPVVVP